MVPKYLLVLFSSQSTIDLKHKDKNIWPRRQYRHSIVIEYIVLGKVQAELLVFPWLKTMVQLNGRRWIGKFVISIDLWGFLFVSKSCIFWIAYTFIKAKCLIWLLHEESALPIYREITYTFHLQWMYIPQN